MLYPVRWALLYLAKFTGSIDKGPTMTFMTVVIIVLFGSAFFTDIIGVHAIFGAFLAGCIVPRKGGLAIALTEKLEDMVTIIFLPLVSSYLQFRIASGKLTSDQPSTSPFLVSTRI
jgi:Kef-type K+ transport system membrane component KefB